MNNSTPRHTASAVERTLQRSNEMLERLIVQTPEEAEEIQSILGKTPLERPESLKDANAVLDRIIESSQKRQEPTAFGKTVTLLRTEQKLSVEKLAERTDLDPEDIIEIEQSHELEPDPMIVIVLAEYFRVPVRKMQRMAGLMRESELGEESGSLHLAAGATPDFSQHTREERKELHRWLRNFRKSERRK